jgi:ABC-type methionine transport system permease subunit
MSHTLLRTLVGILVTFPFVILIAYLMALVDCAFWDMRRKHSVDPDSTD